MNAVSEALRARLHVRIRQLSTQHPSSEIKAEAAQLLAEPSAAGLRELLVQLRQYGPILLLDDLLLEVGEQVCGSLLAAENCDV